MRKALKVKGILMVRNVLYPADVYPSASAPTSTEVNIISVTQISNHFKTIFFKYLFLHKWKTEFDVCVIELYGEIYEVKL